MFHAIGFALALKTMHRIGRREALTVPRVGGLLEILEPGQVEVVEVDLLTFWSLRACAASKTPKVPQRNFWSFGDFGV